MIVRAATEDDLLELNELYNYYVLKTPVTFDVEPFDMDARRDWFSHYATSGPHRVLVAKDEGRIIAGFASSSRFRPKVAYDTSVETSVYVAPGATGRGVGTALYEALFAALEGEDVHRAYAGITMPNPASVALHERFRFRWAALFNEQGYKLGRFWDVAWYEKRIH